MRKMTNKGEGEKRASRPAICIANAEPPARHPDEEHFSKTRRTARQQKRKAADVVAKITGEFPYCSACKRYLQSYKALFGHLRSHRDRNWHGAFPPCNFNPLLFCQRGGRTGMMNLDLNRYPPSSDEEEEESSDEENSEYEENSGDEESTGLDLNRALSSDEDY